MKEVERNYFSLRRRKDQNISVKSSGKVKQGEKTWGKKERGEEEKRRNLSRECFMTFIGISVMGYPTSTLLLFFNHRNREISDTLHISKRAISLAIRF